MHKECRVVIISMTQNTEDGQLPLTRNTAAAEHGNMDGMDGMDPHGPRKDIRYSLY